MKWNKIAILKSPGLVILLMFGIKIGPRKKHIGQPFVFSTQ